MKIKSKTVEISTWGHTGRCASVADLVSDEPVRVRQDGWDRAQDAYARRLCRAAGRGLQMVACVPQWYDAKGAVYQLTFGRWNRMARAYDVAGTCWIKVYR